MKHTGKPQSPFFIYCSAPIIFFAALFLATLNACTSNPNKGGERNNNTETSPIDYTDKVKETAGNSVEYDYGETADGIYTYNSSEVRCEIIIMGGAWTGSFSFVSGFGNEYDNENASYQSGLIRDNDLYDESGYIKIGYIRGGSLTTTVSGKSFTLKRGQR